MKRIAHITSATLAAVFLLAGISLAQVDKNGDLAFSTSNHRTNDIGANSAEKIIVRNRLESGCCWTAYADALIMTRLGGKTSSLIVNADGSGAELFNSKDFDFNWASGPRVGIVGEDILFGCDIEAAFFSIDGWEGLKTITVPDTGANFMVFNQPSTAITLFPEDVVNYRYVSTLRSTEINARHPIWDRLSVLMGFRYVELHEELTSSVNDTEVLNVNTDNHMYGGQIGMVAAVISTCRFSVEGALKVGVFGNHTDSVMDVVDARYGGNRTYTSVLGEINLMGIVQVTNQLALRGGYQAMWIDGISIAGDQVENSNPQVAKPYVGGSLFYHGAIAGLEYAF